jgi:hypothetical protein
MTNHEMRKQIGAAIQRGDLDEALRLLMPPPPRRKSLFELDEETSGPATVYDVDEQELAEMCGRAMRTLVDDVRHDIVEHVGVVLNRLRGRAD